MTELVVFSCYLEEGRSFMGFSKYLDPPLWRKTLTIRQIQVNESLKR
jgi:hypothetical protein